MLKKIKVTSLSLAIGAESHAGKGSWAVGPEPGLRRCEPRSAIEPLSTVSLASTVAALS